MFVLTDSDGYEVSISDGGHCDDRVVEGDDVLFGKRRSLDLRHPRRLGAFLGKSDKEKDTCCDVRNEKDSELQLEEFEPASDRRADLKPSLDVLQSLWDI